MQQKPTIQVERLSKVYGSTVAVDDISFDVHEGRSSVSWEPMGPARRPPLSASKASANPTGATY